MNHSFLIGYVKKNKLIAMAFVSEPDIDLKILVIENLIKEVQSRTDLIPLIEKPKNYKHWHLYARW